MFTAYSHNELYEDVIIIFNRMKSLDIEPNCYTFPIILKACEKIIALREGKQLHCLSEKWGFGKNPFVCCALIGMYSRGSEIKPAYKVFEEMADKNIVAWTSMINGFLLNCELDNARRLFDIAPERDIVLWNTMVSGYIGFGDMMMARKLFDQMPNKDVMSWNTMLHGYARNSDIENCELWFEEMPERNIFSWNGLIGGYACNGCFSEVLSTFKRMLAVSNVVPNDATLVMVFSACARLGALDMGKWVHVYADSIGCKGNVSVGNALIDLYAKCGILDAAVDVFERMDTKDLISWNTIIGGLAIHGRGADALSLFNQMRNAGEKPDGVTFVGILSACAHMGLVQDGFSYFTSMLKDYDIVPQIEHYGCMVDLMGRAGLLEQAVEFVRRMPIKADSVIWASLLGACRVYKNVKVAELALEELTELEPQNPSNYVMLSNIYGDYGRWKDVARLKLAMRDTGLRKLPGCSSIEINDEVVEFHSLDERHPEKKEIYRTLKGLTRLSRSTGYMPHTMELELEQELELEIKELSV
ncbi:Pentatricopeptide repeat [Dillenia turbinata]|uniref:Pentatricopeptide repeat n=1 Tax=Dillenia turbinata TaxID=194707 RepID=A0AAN8VPJ9_9MAGN